MNKIAVIGSRDTVVGFKALGLDTFTAADGAEAKAHLRTITRDSKDYAIIYIEETLAQHIESDINKFKSSPSPAIILIPGREGSLGIGMKALYDAVDKAVGVAII